MRDFDYLRTNIGGRMVLIPKNIPSIGWYDEVATAARNNGNTGVWTVAPHEPSSDVFHYYISTKSFERNYIEPIKVGTLFWTGKRWMAWVGRKSGYGSEIDAYLDKWLMTAELTEFTDKHNPPFEWVELMFCIS